MHAATETVARLRRLQTLRLHRAPDVDEVPCRRLEQDSLCRVGHFRLAAAHHAADRQRAGRVRHQNRERVEFAIRAVERGQVFARFGQTSDDRRRFALGAFHQRVVIEGVQRLPHFEHHVIRDVHDVVDRPHARQPQTALHPIGRFADLHLADQHGGKTRIQFRFANISGHFAFQRNTGLRYFKGRRLELLPGERGNFARDAEHVCVPRHVRVDFHLEHHVANVFGQRHANGGVVVEKDDALVLVADAQFLFGTHHRIGVDAANLCPFQRHQFAPRLVAVVQGRAFFGVGGLDRFGQRPQPFIWK